MNDLFIRQFERCWQLFTETIQRFSAEEWRLGDVDYLIPARAAYHILETAEFYAGRSAQDFPWGHRFGCDWEGAAPDALPGQQDVMVYLGDMHVKVNAWLSGSDLTAEDKDFPWCGGTVADRALYLLRHSHHHIGEMWSQLKRCGHDLPDWS